MKTRRQEGDRLAWNLGVVLSDLGEVYGQILIPPEEPRTTEES